MEIIIYLFFIYVFKSDSRSISEKNKNKTKWQKLHRIRDHYKKTTRKKEKVTKYLS